MSMLLGLLATRFSQYSTSAMLLLANMSLDVSTGRSM